MYSLKEHVFFVKQKNLKEFLRLHGERFNVPHHKRLSKSVIIRTVKKFETTGSIHDEKAEKVGAKQTAQSGKNIDQARKIMYATTPRTSITWVAQEIRISVASAHRILTTDISIFPYKIQVHLSSRSWKMFELHYGVQHISRCTPVSVATNLV